MQRKRADIRQYLDRGRPDRRRLAEPPRSRPTALQGRDLQAVPALPGPARRRHRLRQRARRGRRRPGQAGGPHRLVVGDRAAALAGLLAARRRADPAHPLGGREAATAEEADALGAPADPRLRRQRHAWRASTSRPGAETGRRGRAGCAELADRAARRWRARRATRKLDGARQAPQGAARRRLPPDRLLPLHPDRRVRRRAPGRQARHSKTVVAAVTGTLSPQQRLQRIEELRRRGRRRPGRPPGPGRHRLPVRGRQPPAPLRRRRPLRPGLEPDPPRPARRPRRPLRPAARRGPGHHPLRQRQRHRRQGPRSADQEAPPDPQGPRHLGLRPGRGVDRRDGRDRRVAADARPAAGRAGRACSSSTQHRREGCEQLERDWNSAAEREKASRSRFAQRAIHPEEVAREVAAIRDALGGGRRGPRLRPPGARGPGRACSATTRRRAISPPTSSGTPAGLRDALAAALGGDASSRAADPVPRPRRRSHAARRRWSAPTRWSARSPRYVLDAALDDHEPTAPRPARRCGVIRTTGGRRPAPRCCWSATASTSPCRPGRANGSWSPRTPACSPSRARRERDAGCRRSDALRAAGRDGRREHRPDFAERTMQPRSSTACPTSTDAPGRRTATSSPPNC